MTDRGGVGEGEDFFIDVCGAIIGTVHVCREVEDGKVIKLKDIKSHDRRVRCHMTETS